MSWAIAIVALCLGPVGLFRARGLSEGAVPLVVPYFVATEAPHPPGLGNPGLGTDGRSRLRVARLGNPGGPGTAGRSRLGGAVAMLGKALLVDTIHLLLLFK